MKNRHAEMNNQNLDNLLADFADELLRGGDVDSLAMQGSEMRALQETLVVLKAALVDELPDAAMSARIRKSLSAEWGTQKERVRSAPKPAESWYKQLQRRLNLRPLLAPRAFALGFVTVALLVLAAALLINPDPGTGVAGTALGPAGWIPAAIILLGAGALGLFLLFRSKR